MTIAARARSPRQCGEKHTILRCDYDRLLIELKPAQRRDASRARTGRRRAPWAKIERGAAPRALPFIVSCGRRHDDLPRSWFSVFARRS
jgi:hypothetical protein